MHLAMEKICRRCQEAFTEGTVNRRYCDGCSPIRRRGHIRRATPEQKAEQKAYLAAYHQERKRDPGYIAKRKAESKRYHLNKPAARLVQAARHRAKNFGLAFDLTIRDIQIPQFCPVLGIPLFRGDGARSDNSPTLDRLTPSRGYVKGNVHVISDRANRIKNDGTAEEHRLIASWMEQNQCI